jgi:predicted alpha/beta superfamily hydrolase
MTEFIVHVPDPHNTAPVYLAAGHPDFGHWRAQGQPLQRHHDGTHHLFWNAPPGTHWHGLVTRGHWRNAEVDPDGREPPPHSLILEDGSHFVLRVKRWGHDRVRYHHDFGSELVTHSRTLCVWLPPGYGRTPRRYPVLLMHDGQNLIDAHTSFAGVPWNCDETAEQAVRANECEPFIIVGVANTIDRIQEYGPGRSGTAPSEGQARDYGRFLVESVLPFIAREYDVKPGPENLGVGGSSMGGLISLHLCQWYPRVFGKCLSMSPALWWQQEYFLRSLRDDSDWLRGSRMWLDMGGREGATEAGMQANVERSRELAKQFGELGGAYRYVEDGGGGHDERAWGIRFAEAIRYLFPAKGINAG